MLRALVLILLLCNAGFWAWRHGWLQPVHSVIGARPEGEREPERLARQVHPERLQLALAPDGPAPLAAGAASSPDAAASAASAAEASAATACLEAGPFDAAALAAAQTVVRVLLPADSVTARPLAKGSWWVAMGPFAEAGQLTRKKDELQRRDVPSEEARLTPAGSPLLVLGRHDSREAAEAELASLNNRDVRSARVVDARAAAPQALRVANADADQQLLLSALPGEKLGGHRFEPCPVDAR